MSPFVSPLSAIARAQDPTVTGNVALSKGPRTFCPHRSDCCRAPMLMCQNSSLWQRCECCNNVLSSFWPPWAWSIEQRGHHVTCALIGTSHKLAAYNFTSNLVLWTMFEYKLVDANRGIQKVRACALIGTSRKLAAYNFTRNLELWTTLEYKLVGANGGIQKVRAEPATRSAVVTW